MRLKYSLMPYCKGLTKFIAMACLISYDSGGGYCGTDMKAPSPKRSPVVSELRSLDVALYAIESARRHYPGFYENVWGLLNDRRYTLVTLLSPAEAAKDEVLQAGNRED